MSPREALQYYTAVKLHFTAESYDAFKFNFKTKHLNFEKRPDKHYFNKLARQKDPKGIVIANLAIEPSLWVGRLFETQAQERYQSWKKYQESQTYLFQEEIKQLDQKSFLTINDQHPLAMKLYLRKKISLDTLAICHDFIPFNWENDDPIMHDIAFKIRKYRPFITYNKKKLKEILLDILK